MNNKKNNGYEDRLCKLFILGVVRKVSGIRACVKIQLLESFRLEYEYEIECEYDFRISNQLPSQSPRFSQLLISRGVGFRSNIAVLCDDLEHTL